MDFNMTRIKTVHWGSNPMHIYCFEFLIDGSSEVIGGGSHADSPETDGGDITSSLEAFFKKSFRTGLI